VILLLLACASPRPWTEAEVLAGARAHADKNGDGTVAADELPAGKGVDTNRDGKVDDAELRAWMVKAAAEWRAPGWTPPGGGAPAAPPASEGWMILETLRLEALAADPAAAVPTVADMDRLRNASRLDDPMGQWAVNRIKDACDKAGVAFPKGLLLEPNGPPPTGAPARPQPPSRP
jgi:hypothetical protein